jgi:hypothetical protein
MTLRFLFGMLVVGLSFLGLGTFLGNRNDVRDAGLSPVSLLLKGAGLAILSFTLYRYVHQRL